jgi:hypothetical protein
MGLVSFFDLQSLKDKHDCQFFVETGTFKGDSVRHAEQFGFDKIYSIEIFDELAVAAQEQFKEHEHIKIVHSNSVDGLKSIIDELDGNCIFWLDAHFPGSDVGAKGYDEEKDEQINMPLLEELKLLSRRSNYNDVILIDDLRTFKEVPDDCEHLVNGFNRHMQSIGQPHVKKELLISFTLEDEIKKFYP